MQKEKERIGEGQIPFLLTFDNTFRRGEFLRIIRGHAGTSGWIVDDGRRRAL